MKTAIGIIGVGMLGASLAASLPEERYRRIGWARRKEVGAWAVKNGVLDSFCGSVEELLKESDVAVICLPVPTIIEYIQKYAPAMKEENVVVTDIGSVKGCIEKRRCPRESVLSAVTRWQAPRNPVPRRWCRGSTAMRRFSPFRRSNRIMRLLTQWSPCGGASAGRSCGLIPRRMTCWLRIRAMFRISYPPRLR